MKDEYHVAQNWDSFKRDLADSLVAVAKSHNLDVYGQVRIDTPKPGYDSNGFLRWTCDCRFDLGQTDWEGDPQ